MYLGDDAGGGKMKEKEEEHDDNAAMMVVKDRETPSLSGDDPQVSHLLGCMYVPRKNDDSDTYIHTYIHTYIYIRYRRCRRILSGSCIHPQASAISQPPP